MRDNSDRNKIEYEMLVEISVFGSPGLKTVCFLCLYVCMSMYAALERKLRHRFPPNSQPTNNYELRQYRYTKRGFEKF